MAKVTQENNFATAFPELAKQWHPTKNQGLTIETVQSTSKKYWWICERGHSYEMNISDKKRGRKCPVCTGKKIVVGVNDLLTTNSKLAEEWHPTKNGELKPTDVTTGNGKKVWWMCAQGHEWKATPSHRNAGYGCPYCSNQKVLLGFNDLATTHPKVANMWHPTKNGDLKPTDIIGGGKKKYWWICEKGHTFLSTVDHLKRGGGCPVCHGKQIFQGFNDLATTNPEIVKEWHPTKNGDLKPTDVSHGSETKVWWICEHGHEWEARVCNRVNGNGCPICSNRGVLVGYNDLKTLNPELAKEWHPTKNGNLKPTDVTKYSNKKVWWQCKHGHEWEAVVGSRSSGGGCPYCSHNGTSRQELILLYYIRKFSDVEVKHRYIVEKKEIDVFLCRNNEKIGIEYDGYYAHKDKRKKDISKNRMCEKMGVKLYRIREKPLFVLNSTSIDLSCDAYKYNEYSNLIKQLIFKIFEIDVVVDIDKDKHDIEAFFKLVEIEESLAINYPELAEEWHPTKNGKLKPEHISCGSGEKVWWLGKCGHEWDSVPYTRTKSTVDGHGCPICNNKRVLVGYNDLATTHPELAGEWHPTKNGDLKPIDVVAGSHQRVWWLGKCGHEWQATIVSRAYKNIGCLICSNHQILIGYNDLATTHPELAREWHPTKNGNSKPTDIVVGSNKKVWWQCERGHEWKNSPSNRRNGGCCPFCSKQLVLTGYNDLATTHPELAKEWHPIKNGDLKPTDIISGGKKRFWWLGKCGHEWQATVADRKSGYNCPFCSNRRTLAGFNDIVTTHPKIAAEWHPTKNGDLKPTDVVAGSGKRVWWLCKCGQEWQASIYSRTKGAGCPICRVEKK